MIIRPSRVFAGGNWKRAAGELALIVIGVTIALWADTLVDERNDRSREQTRLAALLEDAVDTLAALESARDNASGAAKALRQIVDLEPPFEPDGPVIELLRHGLLYGSDFHAEMPVYSDLKSSGELALLTNSELRQALSRMDSGLERLQLAQADLTTVQQLNIDSYMVDHIELRAFYGRSTGLQPPAGGVHVDLGFIADDEFQNRILLKLDLVTQLEMALTEAQTRLRAVQQLVETELDG